MGTKKGDRDPPFPDPTGPSQASPDRPQQRPDARSGLAFIRVALRILVHQFDDLVDKEHDDDDGNEHTDDRADNNGIKVKHLILLSACSQA
jgi:hypothetical protein